MIQINIKELVGRTCGCPRAIGTKSLEVQFMKDLLVRIGQKTKTIIKRGSPLAMAISLFAGVALGSLPMAKATAASVQNLTPSPRVSFTFDDGMTSALAKAAPTLAAHGLTGTDYIITGCVGMTTAPNTCAANPNATYMAWSDIQQLHTTYGWEIGSHTVTHPQLALADGAADGSLPGGATQVTSELVNSKQALADHGYDATDLAFPYGDYDNNALAETAKYYESARGFADLGYNTWPYTSDLIVNQQVQGGVTVAAVEAYIDAAIANNQWLVLTFHDIADNASTVATDYQYSTADLDAIAAYVKTKQDAGAIKAVNVTDGMVRGTNMLPNGDFANGIADGWSTDDPTNITADSGNNGRYPDPTHSVSLKTSATATTDSHLFSPQVSVSPSTQYIIKNYVNILSGGEVDFYVDEYDAAGTWLSGQYHQGITYGSAAGTINVSDLNFAYTPTSATVAKARLQVIVHGANTAAYYDGAQWLSTAEVAVTPPVDTTPPVVSNVTVSNATATGATISWTTDEPSTGTLNYGTTASYGQSVAASTLSTTHGVTLTGLTASTNYQYQIVAADAAANTNSATTGSFGTIAATVLGDLDNNGVVNGIDLSTLLGNWNTTTPSAAPVLGDLDGNGLVNGIDLSTLLGNWSN